MPELLFLHSQVLNIALMRRRLNRPALHHLDSVALQAGDFLRIVGEEPHPRGPQVAQDLGDLRATRVRLLTNNPQKITGLEGYGVKVVERRPIETPPHQGNIQYLRVKKEKLGHLFTELKPLL